jgi:hypothetical protein
MLASSVLVAHSRLAGNPRFYPFEEPGLGHVLALLPPKWPDMSPLLYAVFWAFSSYGLWWW